MKPIALARLMQLCSQALPVGGYSHSHGLESAIESRIVTDEASVLAWIADQLEFTLCRFEVPLLLAMSEAWATNDALLVTELNDEFLATRESAELRAASVQMGYSLRALLRVLPEIPAATMAVLQSMAEPALPCVWSAVMAAWEIDPPAAVVGYLWSWAENQVLVAMKTVPLGQSAGQRVLLQVGSRVARLADTVVSLPIDACSNFSPGLAILASQHESQYSRLFRS